MKFRFSIGRKIGLGFGTLIFLTLFAFSLTMLTLRESREINKKISTIYSPSVSALQELNLLVVRSKMLISSWVNIQVESEHKVKLKKLIYEEFPDLKERIKELAENWNKDEQESIRTIFAMMNNLLAVHKDIMSQLKDFDSYEDPQIIYLIRPSVEDEDGEVNEKTRLIINLLGELVERQEKNVKNKKDEEQRSFSNLKNVVVALGIALPLGGILIAVFTVITIVRPIHSLKKILLQMAKGILPKEKIKDRNDEIGEMSTALNELVGSMNLSTEFAKEVGAGNFDSYFKPLSDDDSLGLALMKMREDLAVNERILERKVEERTAQVVKQKEEIELQSRKIEVLYNHVTDSIKYAKRIQEAILPPDSLVRKLLPDSFVFYKPKDIVSGDFYWMEANGDNVLFAAVDCTGHGVPGAFMSIVAYNQLKLVINKLGNNTQPSKILDELSKGVSDSLHQKHDESTAKDGMDITLCSLNMKKKELEFAGAFNPLLLVRDGQLQEIKTNKFPVGIFLGKEAKNFTNHKIALEKGDVIYIFSDGYSDQFGGPKGKKFMINQFRNLLLKIYTQPMAEQKKTLETTLEQWRNNEEQVDDILVLGVRVN